MSTGKILLVVDEFWPVESAPAVRIHSLMSAFEPGRCEVLAGVFEQPDKCPEGWHLLLRDRSGHPLKILCFLAVLTWRLLRLVRSRQYAALVISVPKYELLLAVPLLRRFVPKLVIDVRDTLEFLDYEAYFAKFMPRVLAKPLGWLARKFSNYLRTGAFKHADLVSAANPAIAQSMQKFNARVELISNGVDTRHFRPATSPNMLLDKLELTYMGNFVEKDDFTLVASVARQLGSQVRINLIGEGRHKDNIIATLGSDVLLRDFGRVAHSDIPRLLQGMHIGFIFRSETVCASIPVALYEFSSMNIPVLCNDTGIMGDFVRKHDLGWVVSSERELLAVLQEILKHPAGLDHYRALHAYADTHFSRQAAAKRFKECLDNLLQ